VTANSRRCLFLAILVAALPATIPAPEAQPPTEPAQVVQPAAADTGVPWTELRFVARKFLLSARATLSARVVPAAEAAALLLSVPEGTARGLTTPFLIETRLASDLPFGRREVAIAWVAPGGAALQSEKQGAGRKLYERRRRYTTEGYYSWRSEPDSSTEKKLEAEGWTRRGAYAVSWTEPPTKGVAVTDSYALLYLVSAARLDRPGARLRLHVFSRRQLVEVEFKAGGQTRLEVDFDEVHGDRTTRRRGTIPVCEVHGTPVGDGDDVQMGLMGLRGALKIFVEPGTGMPLEIRGRADHLGEIRIRLERVVLKPTGQPEASDQ